MQDSLKKLSPAVFAVAVVCFIFPWVNFSCQGQRVATFTGLQLVTGTTIQQQGMFGQRLKQKRKEELQRKDEQRNQELQRKVEQGEMTQEQMDRLAETAQLDASRLADEPSRVGSEPLAVAVLLSTVLGLALSFLKGKKLTFMPTVVGLVAFILLLLLKSKIETDATSETEGMIQAEFAIGFWMVLILFIGAIALNGYLYFSSRDQVQTTKPQT